MKKARTVKISKLFVLVVVFLFAAIIVKLSYVVLSPKVDGIDLTAFAQRRNTQRDTIVAERGTIYDKFGNIMAINVNSYNLIAILSDKNTTDPENPRHVVDKEYTAEMLSTVIDLSKDDILGLLNTEDVFQVEFGTAGKGLTELQKESIDALGLPGIDFIKSVRRYYPNRDFLSYTLGYAKKDENDDLIGEMGLELAYNKILTGTNGYREYESDIYGYKMAMTPENVVDAQNGKDLYLTIDTNIQMFAEQAITKLESASSLEWATVSVVNAKTGEILAVASNPSFDPNIKDIVNYYDPFVSYTYEPGSTMKIFSFMAAIENGLYDGEETYQSGTIKVDDAEIKDWNDYGWGTITFDQGFYGSSNVAATLLSQKLGGQLLKDFYSKLGYGKKTDIGLPNEMSGSISFKYDVEVANASFGQGMSVTPVQMIQALTSLANDGTVLKPYLVSKVVDSETGEIVQENGREEVGKVASKDTINQMKELLWGVINSTEIMATGTAYKTDFITTIGKTGTAEIPSPDGGYLTGYNDYIRSFAGLFPYEDPQIIVYVAVSKISDSTLISSASKTLIEDVSTYLGIVDEDAVETSTSVEVGSYINKSLDSVKEKVENKDIIPVIIGDGSRIIKQYPNAGTIMDANEKLFLLTNGTDIKYTNVEGWSRNDLDAYSNLLGVTFNYSGYGYAKGVSIADRNVVIGETIDIELAPKYTSSST